jgi:hypothetical protein
VDRQAEPGRLTWQAEPARVTVRQESQVTIDPDTASWVAVLRYDVSGGPLDAIRFELPSDWGRDARVTLAGAGFQRESETVRDRTSWLIRPDRPIWGSQRVVVRSTLPFRRGATLSFPDLRPHGRAGYSGVHTYLRIVKATRETISPEGTSGLLRVAASALPREPELDGVSPASVSLAQGSAWNYQVVKNGWALRVQRPGDWGPGGPGRAEARVLHAELNCTLAADGSSFGMARYELEPRSGPFLGVSLDTSSEVIWTSVNGTPSQPLKSGPGRWLVPLNEDPVSRVILVWRSARPAPGGKLGGGPSPVAVPVPTGGPVPTVVTVRAPDGLLITSPAGHFQPSSADQVELEKAKWNARDTAGSLQGFDRSSRRDGENLVASLIRSEMLLRQAERAAGLAPGGSSARRQEAVGRVKASADAIRADLSGAVLNAALDEFARSARAHLGTDPDGTSEAAVPTPDPALPVNVRGVGVPHPFQGTTRPDAAGPWLVCSPGAVGAERPWRLALAALGLAMPALSWWVARRTRWSPWAAGTLLAALLALTTAWAGPGGLLAGLGLAVLGRVERGSA